MRKTLFICCAALAASLVVPALASASGRYSVTQSSLSVRSKAGSFARGALYRTEHVDVHSFNSNNWAWGYVYGTYNGCGWVWGGPGDTRPYLNRGGQSDQGKFKDKCGAPRDFAFSSFGLSLGKKGPGPNGNDGSFAHLNDCPSKGYYGNYDTSSHRLKHPLGALKNNADLRYRYTARNSDGSRSKVALVREDGNSAGFFFVRKACVENGKPPTP